MHHVVISGIRPSFPGLSQSAGQVTHVLLTRSPLVYPRKGLTVRLACVKHAASVRPEPGSNSPTKTLTKKHKNKLAQNQKIKARHTVEFSKDTRTSLLIPGRVPRRRRPAGLLTGPSEGRRSVRHRADLDNGTPRLSASSNRPPPCRMTCANLLRLRSAA